MLEFSIHNICKFDKQELQKGINQPYIILNDEGKKGPFFLVNIMVNFKG